MSKIMSVSSYSTVWHNKGVGQDAGALRTSSILNYKTFHVAFYNHVRCCVLNICLCPDVFLCAQNMIQMFLDNCTFIIFAFEEVNDHFIFTPLRI